MFYVQRYEGERGIRHLISYSITTDIYHYLCKDSRNAEKKREEYSLYKDNLFGIPVSSSDVPTTICGVSLTTLVCQLK